MGRAVRSTLIELTIKRAGKGQEGYDPREFQWKTLDYERMVHGEVRQAKLYWKSDLRDVLARLGQGSIEAQAELGDLLGTFLVELGLELPSADARPETLHIALRFAAAELYALPWELARVGGRELGSHAALDLRYVLPGEPHEPGEPVGEPEQQAVLFAWSQPEERVPHTSHRAAINAALERAAQPPLQELANTSYELLADRLREAKAQGRPITILHLLAHGGPVEGELVGLVLDEGRVDGRTLGRLLSDYADTLRLVVLCACRSSDPGRLDAHIGSVAQELSGAGIESVIASRMPLTVEGSIILTEALYRSLASFASLEQGLRAARSELLHSASPGDAYSIQRYAQLPPKGALDTRPLIFRPYRGLQAFRPEHAPLFLGRGPEVEELHGELLELLARGLPRIQVVEGASGSGKSSLVFAGLVPKLIAQGGWVYADMVPGAAPLVALEDSLIKLHALLDAEPRSRALLIIDQFEELFTYAEGSTEPQKFGRRMWEIATEPEGRINILCTMRTDFRGNCGAVLLEEVKLGEQGEIEGRFLDSLFDDPRHNVFVPRMPPERLVEVVETPAALVGLQLEQGLAKRIVTEVGGEPGALPLLQFAMDQVWRKRRGSLLTNAAFDELGAAGGALEKRADELVAHWKDSEQHGDKLMVARTLLVRLVHRGTGGARDTRRRRKIAEIPTHEHPDFEAVLDTLVDERMLVRSSGKDKEPMVEIAHEALIRSWKLLRDWLEEDQVMLTDFARLERWAEETELLTRDQLGYAREVRDKWGTQQLSAELLALIERSERAVRKQTITAASLALVVLVISATAAVYFRSQKLTTEKALAELEAKDVQLNREFRRQKGLHATNLAATPGEELNALRIAIEGVGPLDSDEQPAGRELRLPAPVFTGLASALMSIEGGLPLDGHAREITDLALSPKGTDIVTASVDGTVRLWDAQSCNGRGTFRAGTSKISAIEYSPSGDHIAFASEDGNVHVWSASTPRLLGSLEHPAPVVDLEITRDGQRLISACEDELVRVWALAFDEAGQLVAQDAPLILSADSDKHPIHALALAQDDARFATAGDSVVRLWNTQTCALERELDIRSRVNAVAFGTLETPEGSRSLLASTGRDGRATIWNPATGERLSELELHDVGLSLGFSRDATQLAVGTYDENLVQLWELDPAELSAGQVTSFHHEHPIFALEFSPHAEQLVTASGTQGRSWDTTPSPAQLPLLDHWERVDAIAFSPDGEHFATGSGDNTARVWDASRGVAIASLEGHELDVASLSFSADSAYVATASWDGSARVWERRTGIELRRFEGHEARVLSVAFTPDSRHVLSGGEDRKLRKWRVIDGAEEQAVELDAAVHAIAVSAACNCIATATRGLGARIYSLEDMSLVRTVSPAASVRDVAISPDGRWLATASADDRVRLWAIHDVEARAIELSGHSGDLISVAFSPDGTRLASGGDDDRVRLWDISDVEAITILVAIPHESPVVSLAFSPDGRRLATANGRRAARVFQLDPSVWLDWGCDVLERREAYLELDPSEDELRIEQLDTQAICAQHRQRSSGARPGDADPRAARVSRNLPVPKRTDDTPRETLSRHGVEFVLVKGGTFWMGAAPGEGDGDEHPRHQVELEDFYLARTELTNAQFARYLEANPEREPPKNWADEANNQPDQPVVFVTWAEAKAYCDWAGFVLPTEAQWEYAARAGTQTRYWYGDAESELGRVAWYIENSGGRTHFVGKKDANPNGLYDIHGNAFEWCLDGHGNYASDHPPRPGDGLRHEPEQGAQVDCRGGSWFDYARYSRAANRYQATQNFSDKDIGFRPALSVAAARAEQ